MNTEQYMSRQYRTLLIYNVKATDWLKTDKKNKKD